MNFLELVQHNSVGVATFIRACLIMAIAFDIPLTPGQQAAVLGVVEAGLALFVKQNTVSTQRVDKIVENRMGDIMTDPAGGVAPAHKK